MLEQVKALYQELQPTFDRTPDRTSLRDTQLGRTKLDNNNIKSQGKQNAPGITNKTDEASSCMIERPCEWLEQEEVDFLYDDLLQQLTTREIRDSRQNDNLLPREKLEVSGAASLNNIELLCLLLGSGSKHIPVQKLANRILPLLLQQTFSLELKTLLEIKGMGLGKSTAILAAMELARRVLNPSGQKLKNPEAIHKQIAHFADQQENLIAINLNGACEAISIRLVTRGTINQSLIHPREVFTYAIREQAHSIIIAHNHPTGYLQPSAEDISSTRRLEEAARILGVKLLDHIIFSQSNYLSFSEQGLMQH